MGDKRSKQANSYYFGVVVKESTEFFQEHPEKLLPFLLASLQGGVVNQDMMHSLFKTLFNKGRSSSNLPVNDFYLYINEIRDNIYHYCDLTISVPDDQTWRDYDSK